MADEFNQGLVVDDGERLIERIKLRESSRMHLIFLNGRKYDLDGVYPWELIDGRAQPMKMGSGRRSK
jgi:hypothetical protein